KRYVRRGRSEDAARSPACGAVDPEVRTPQAVGEGGSAAEREASTPAAAPHAAQWNPWLRTPPAAGESGNRSDDRAERTKRYVRRGRSEDAARSPACGAVEPVAADAAGGRRGRQRSRARAE